ncbi:MAG: DegT/DnrJ/EryC1/StrS family aminotransferase [Spirochaetales bacterium]|nr:DegT/DnrJ/EryC1/StrS family aminotransferase [Spirochaetales bacterium]
MANPINRRRPGRGRLPGRIPGSAGHSPGAAGRAARAPIPFARPSVGREEERAIVRVLRSGWLTTGRVTAEFEAAFAAYVGTGHALAVSSATAGLHLALEALKLEPDDEVITTPYTFAATAEVVRYTGAHPRFIDIEEDTLNIDPALVERSLERKPARVKAIIPVHIGGLPCAMGALTAVSARFGIPLVEDCAHAFPVRAGGRHLGTHGKVGVYSFYANKTITTGEGGMAVTDDGALAARMKVMRTHGIDRESWDRYTSPDNSWQYRIVAAGFKYNLTDIASAIGIEQLKKAEALKALRTRAAERYLRGLAGCDFLELPAVHPEHAWHLFIVLLKPDRLTIGRDEFISELAARSIGASVHYTPLHVMPYYRDAYGYPPEDFPVALKQSLACVSLPLYPDLSEEDSERVIAAVKAIGEARRPPHLRAP